MPGVRRNRVRRLSPQRAVQLISAALLNGYWTGFRKGRIFTGASKALCVPVLNCYSCPGALGACPIGALQTAIGGARRHLPFYVLGVLMLFGVLLGRLACGLLCPFGLVQDLLHKVPLPKRRVPRRLDRAARRVKYGVLLVLVILLPAFAVTEPGVSPPYFCQFLCPAGTLEGGLPLTALDPALRNLTGWLFRWKVLVLAVILGASLVIHRPFCRYLCPLGAFYGLFNRFSFFQMRLNREKCVECGQCLRICPMAVDVLKNLNSAECIRCGACQSACPTGAVTAGVSGQAGLHWLPRNK